MSSDILSDISLDILSDISSDISFDILSDISSDIFSDISFDILSDISCDILSDMSSDSLSDILLSDAFRSRGPARHTELTGSRLRSGTPHWTHRIPVDVRHTTLNSHNRGFGPAHHTELCSAEVCLTKIKCIWVCFSLRPFSRNKLCAMIKFDSEFCPPSCWN